MLNVADWRSSCLIVLIVALFVSACAERPPGVATAPQTTHRPHTAAKPRQSRVLPHTNAPFVPLMPALIAPPLALAQVEPYMDALESELRRHVHGGGVRIMRIGDDITIVLPTEVLFAKDGTLDGGNVLHSIGAVLSVYVHTSIMVCGYTDTAGDAEINLAASQKRARLVANSLLQQGIALQRISSEGFGESHLKIATGDNKVERRNRRIEILLHARPG